MQNNTIRTTVELEVNRDLEAAFRAKLEDDIAGFYLEHDKQDAQTLIDELTRKQPAEWSARLKKELMLFIMALAGFSAAGYTATDWHNPNQN